MTHSPEDSDQIFQQVFRPAPSDSLKTSANTTPPSNAAQSARSFLSNQEQSTSALRPGVEPSSLAAQNPSSNSNNAVGDNSQTSNFSARFNPFRRRKAKPTSSKKPLAAALAIVSLLAFIIIGGSSTFPFAYAARTVLEFNSIGHSNSIRNTTFRRLSFRRGLSNPADIDQRKYKYPVSQNLFGENFRVSKKQQKKLAEQGIIVKKGSMEFHDGTGKIYHIQPDEFDNFFKTHPDFRNGYLAASKTWRGHYSGWFDRSVLKVMARIGVDLRSKFKHFQQVDDVEKGNQKFRDMAKRRNLPLESAAETWEQEDKRPKLDANGKPITDANGNPVLEQPPPNKTKDAKLDTPDSIKSHLADISKISNTACIAFDVANSLQMIVAAHQAIETVNLISGFLESVDKVKAGEGAKSPMNNYLHMMTQPDRNGKTALASYGVGSMFGMGGTGRRSFNDSDSILQVNREGIFSKFQVGKDLSLECAYARLGTNIASAAVEVMTLGGASIAKSVIKIFSKIAVKDVLIALIAPAILSASIDLASKILIQNYVDKLTYLGEDGGNALAAGSNLYLSENAKSGGQSPADQARVLAYQRQVVARSRAESATFARANLSPFDLSSEYTFLGSIMYQTFPIFLRSQSALAAANATAGVALRSFANVLPSASALADTRLVQATGNCPLLDSLEVVGDPYCNPYYITDPSTIEETPASIYNQVYHLRKKPGYHDSPADGETGQCVVKTPLGIKYNYNTPTNFILKEPKAIYPKTCDLVVEETEEGNPIINIHSALGGYIRFCGQRGSQLGLADGNIASVVKYTDFNTGEFSGASQTIANSRLLGLVPIVGDLVDALDAFKDAEKIPWITGEVCVASPKNKGWDTEYRYYQRYSEDQRLLENTGMLSQSGPDRVVEESLKAESYGGDTAFIPDLFGQSELSLLSRFSGLTPDQTLATLQAFQHYRFIANYHPDRLLPLTPPPSLADFFRTLSPAKSPIPRLRHRTLSLAPLRLAHPLRHTRLPSATA